MEELFEEIKKMQRRMFEEFYRRPFFSWPGAEAAKSKELIKFDSPAADFKDTNKGLIARFDLPGIDKKDIQLHVTEDEIEVKAEKKQETEKEEKGFFHQERSYQGFYRKSTLPVKVRPEAVEAEYQNGVLTVRMPKKEVEHKRAKEIEIKIK